MKFRVLLFLFPFILSFSGCKTIDKLTQFDIEYDSEMTIPATLGINIPIDIWTPNIPTNSNSTFESNNTHKNLIEKVVLTQMKMSITTEGASWDFLKSIEIYISADGLDETKIAWYNNIPKTGLKDISLETSDKDLKEYIKKDTYKLRTKTVTRQIISKNIDVNIKSIFFVDAKILGI